jgi:hypothetical protein
LFLGEVGTSELLVVDKVYDDSVRSVFRGARKDVDAAQAEADMEVEPDSKETYNEKEMNYYISNEEQVDPEEKIEIIKRHDS